MDAAHLAVLLPIWYLAFLLSLTFHEAAHAFVAWRGGDDTAHREGQVSLNPLPHVRREPLGTILVPLVTYFQVGYMMGWASAPYDPHWEARYPKRAALMAAAGPAANLALAAVGFAALRIGLGSGAFSPAPASLFGIDQLVVATVEGTGLLDGLARLLSVLLVLNVALFLFNLIPLPPMDGIAIAAGFLDPARRLRAGLHASPLAGFGGLLLAWLLFPHLFQPVLGWVLARLYA